MVVLKWVYTSRLNTCVQLNYLHEEVAPLPMQITLGLESHITHAYNFCLYVHVATAIKHTLCILLW